MINHDNRKRGGGARLTLAICLTAVLSVGLLSKDVPSGYGYAADGTCQVTGLAQTHSTFHYEFTRVLAVAAGFNETEAETIAVANEATDTGNFTGYPIKGGAITVEFENTERLQGDNATLWYHMPRRSEAYPIVTQPNGQPYPGALANTCAYFTEPSQNPLKAPCAKSRMGELDQLREWAINGAALPTGKAPTVKRRSVIPHDRSGNISGQNLFALGIYLHAVGDSYSHEKCMMHKQIRAHVPQPDECKGTWHVTSEFGDYQGPEVAVKGAGVPFTLTAAKAVWQEILKYRAANAQGPSRWDENQYMSFASAFVTTESAMLRVRKAVGEFNQLTGETVTPQPCASSDSSKPRIQ
ncbi:MAG TPA: hypothetical protein VKA60_24470 [Blastocatellia bacterium]|nr:hypothetical protein [Blastocatellia bacterium]